MGYVLDEFQQVNVLQKQGASELIPNSLACGRLQNWSAVHRSNGLLLLAPIQAAYRL